MSNRYFLDTNILLGALIASRRLDATTRELLENRENDLMTSAVCIWEVAIKHHRYPDSTPAPADIIAVVSEFGVTLMNMTAEDCLNVARLPRLHADPYDHLILAQARRAGARLMTSDRVLGRYGDDVMVVKLKP